MNPDWRLPCSVTKFRRAALRWLPAVLLGAFASARADELTLEWLLDPENLRNLHPPRVVWAPDETLLFEDPSRPEAERTLERLDPRSLERRVVGDPPRLLAAWKALVGEEAAPKRVSQPAEVSNDGRSFLYVRSGDLFVADVEASTVRRITNTEAEEESPQLSPDGKSVAYVRDHDLHVADLATGKERRLTRDGSTDRLNGTLSWVYWEEIMDRSDDASWWAPDSSAILYFQTDESSVTRFPIIDHEPWVPTVRWQRYPKAGTENPTVRAGIVEVATGQTRWVDIARSNDVEYLARVAWSPSSKEAGLVTLNRAQNKAIVWGVDRLSGAARRLHEETSSTWINLHNDLRFLPPGDRFLWVSETSGHRHLALHSAGGGTPLPLTSGNWVLRSAGGRAPYQGSVAWVDSTAGIVYFHAAHPTPLETHLYQVKLDGQDLRKVTEGEGSHRVTFSPAGRYFVDESSRSGVPPRLTLHRADGTLIHVIHAARTEKLTELGLSAPELLTIPGEGGVPLHARLYRPQPLAEGQRYPAIVYVYGGPNAPAVSDRWEGTWYLWSQLLARKGFVVFTVDPRSSSDQGKALEDTVHRKFYGEGELKDILAGVRYLKSLPYVAGDRVGIWGWSGGGTNTYYAMTHSEEFRAGIAVAGVADQRYYDTIYTERYMGQPRENEEGYNSIAPPNAADKLHGRLLIVHGTADDNVHPQNALRMVHALIAAGKQFELMLYPRRDHGIGDPVARRHLFRLMLDFWERELRSGAL